jgi:acetoin:2,6-dichlorophenolindophenol oxidoreductase subunit alpha
MFIECVTKRWPGSNPLWPDLVTGVTGIRTATGEVPIQGEHADWYRHHDPVLRLARALASFWSRRDRAHSPLRCRNSRRDSTSTESRALASPFPEAEAALTKVFAGASLS